MSFNRKNSRKRNRDELNSLVESRGDSEDEMRDRKAVQTILFQNEDLPLILNERSSYFTSGKTNYDEELIGADNFWHQIIIKHQKKFDVKTKVLPEIYKIVGDELFAPIAYRSSREVDFFFMHRQGEALRKLFDNDLRVCFDLDVDGMQVKKQVNLVVKLCVAQFVAGMLTLPDKLSKIISTSVGRSCPTLMNLKHIATHQQLTDVKFTLNNQGCFNLLVDGLNKNQHLLQNVRALSLSNNEIASLKPLSKLVGLNLHTLDLQYNKINSFDEFVHLEHLNLHEVILIGNSITNVPMFKEKIKNILPTLKKVDSTDVKPSTSADNRSEPIRLFKDNDIKIRAVDVNDYLKKTFAQHDSKLWNRVTVTHKGKVTKKNILVHVNRQLFKRTLFIPCYYESGPKIDIFYLHDNFEALNALVQNNLAMTIPTIDTEFKFELHLKCADWIDGHVNWRNKINFAVKKRLKGSKLNLDDFSEDSDLNDNLIVTMSSIAVLRHVLKTALELNRNIVTMTVRDNKITTVEGFQFLKNFPELKSLDLSKNYIESFETLPCLPTVVEVLVGGNPLCTEFYNAPWRYIEKMMRFFPNLQYIDGLRIEKSFIPIVTLQNYLVSPSAYCLSETFVKRFFKIYDSRSRTSLAEFYDNNAIFSVSVNFPQMNNAFNGKSRNLLQNMRNIENEVFVGNRNIVDFFESLPDSQHDFPTMCIDVPMMSEKNILITINGFFKEQGESLNAGDVYFKFTRTFNLERLNPVFETFRNTFRFMIKNDLLQVQQIRVDESLKAFKKNVIQKDEIKKVCWDLTPNIPQARSASTLILKELTKLKTSFCQRLLEDTDWDLEAALQHFLALIDRNFFSEDDFSFRNVQCS